MSITETKTNSFLLKFSSQIKEKLKNGFWVNFFFFPYVKHLKCTLVLEAEVHHCLTLYIVTCSDLMLNLQEGHNESESVRDTVS